MIYLTEFTCQIKGKNYLKTFPSRPIEANNLEEAESYCQELGPNYRIVGITKRKPRKSIFKTIIQLLCIMDDGDRKYNNHKRNNYGL